MFLTRIITLGRKKDTPYATLNRELVAIGSAIRVEGRRISFRNRSCQVFGKYIDFWENQMKWLGVDCVKDEREMAYLLHFWLELRLNSSEIEKRIPGIHFPESRKKIEEGEDSFLNWYWQNLISRKDRRFGQLIELFASNERTRRLMSFTRLRDFMFSNRIPPKETGFPLPFVRITDSWEFEVHVSSFAIVDDEEGEVPRHVLGKGTAEQVFELVLSYLPPNVGTARYEWSEEESSPAA